MQITVGMETEIILVSSLARIFPRFLLFFLCFFAKCVLVPILTTFIKILVAPDLTSLIKVVEHYVQDTDTSVRHTTSFKAAFPLC